MSGTSTLTSPPDVAAPRRPVAFRLAWFAVAVVVAAVIALASVAFGARLVGWSDIVSAFTGEETGIAQAAVQKRVPRTLLALLIGAALGLSGAVMQGVTRNPLADPGILGVTNGAALAVVTGIAFFSMTSPTTYIFVAIAGAAVSAIFVYSVGSLGRGGATPLKLALAGAATAAAFSSLVSAILLPRINVMNEFRFWQIGGVGGATFASISLVLPFLLVGAVICVASARGLNSLALGEDVAAGLGERVATTRLTAAAGAVLLCGAATAVAGPIGFVGLVVPHVCRLLVGIDHRWLLPFSTLVGAILLTAADVVGRVVARPSEVDVGIITALVGAPFFIYIVRRQKVRSL
ncbi:MAG TPA: iron ABC transporter permease [Propionibacteriaceae bacterium]|nr:iron ABC transporter permease [Propionibacteriaceae bacterium]